jgi:adenylosuccinate lyase
MTPELLAINPLDGRYAEAVEPLRGAFSEYALIRNRARVEIAWLQALCAEPRLPEARALCREESRMLEKLAADFPVEDARRVKEIERVTRHDVKAVELFLRERLAETTMRDLSPFLHFACTSEDINNVAHALMAKEGRAILLRDQRRLLQALSERAREWADLALLARTHGQPASPTTIGKEFGLFRVRLGKASRAFGRVALPAKMNGAVGNYNAHVAAAPEVDWPALAGRVLASFGLKQNEWTAQIEPHDGLAELFDALARWNGILLDLDRDLWLYISYGVFRQKIRSGEVGSSTMPHKVNPIDFENSEGNLGLSNALLRHFSEKLPVSRLQRDLSDSTVLRNMGVAFGHALVACRSSLRGLEKLEVDRRAVRRDLDGAWEVLAEPIQTMLRRAGVEDAYEQLKHLTRGRKLTRAGLRRLIGRLDLSTGARERLLAMAPEDYVGLAPELARRAADKS